MAKHRRATHHPKPQRANHILYVLHSDVCGPYPIASLGGGLYVVTLLDEMSGYCAVAILKRKEDAPAQLQRMINEWQNLTGVSCKTLFTDRGGEYISGGMKDYCAERGIFHDFSVPRTPKQNGKAERLNQTLNNITRSLLFQYDTYTPLWAHAMVYAALIYNCSLCARHGLTRYEAFHGDVPNVKNFRTFGCKVYARVADTQRKKLDPKSQIGIYLGPEINGPGHKVMVYNPNLKQQRKYVVHIVRDIVTYESLTAVRGVQEHADIYWGGSIPLPKPRRVDIQPEPLEALTGEPHLPSLPLHPAPLVTEVDQPDALEQGLGVVLPQRVEGDHQRHDPGLGQALPEMVNDHPYRLRSKSHALAQREPAQPVRADVPRVEAMKAPSDVPRLRIDHPRVVQSTGVTPPASSTGETTPAPNAGETTPAPSVGVAAPAPILARVMPASGSLSVRNGVIKRVGAANTAIAKRVRFHHDSPDAGTGVSTSVTAGDVTPGDAPAHAVYPSVHPELDTVLTLVSATAFSASVVYPGPPEHAKPDKTVLVNGLLREFSVPFVEGPEPVISQVDPKSIPSSLPEAMASPYAPFWAEAIVEEWLSIIHNNTWILVEREPWMKIIPCKWVFTIKTDADGVPVRFKARLVAGGHRQIEGIDYEATYAPVSRLATLRTTIAVAANKGWAVHQLDIKTAFLHGTCMEEVYMKQPVGFIDGEDLEHHLHLF